MAQACQGDSVSIRYTGRLSDGTIFDSTEDGEPLEFTAGGGQVIEGVEQAVIGMEEGDCKKISIPPSDGFGEHNPDLEQTIPRDQLPNEVQVGDQLRALHGDREIPVWVRQLGEEDAVVDANHPLAGQTLDFELELLSVRPVEA